MISIHAPTRGATVTERMRASVSLFQSTLPREERQCIICIIIFIQYQFQSTLPREERLCHLVFINYMYLDFNPRSHERSDDSRQQARVLSANISIHAPTRGATRNKVFEPVKSSVNFNPRSHERSDKARWTSRCMVGLFQSTLPREERPFLSQCTDSLLSISIHAPTRGATQ